MSSSVDLAGSNNLPVECAISGRPSPEARVAVAAEGLVATADIRCS
jgi:hypothetical protein